MPAPSTPPAAAAAVRAAAAGPPATGPAAARPPGARPPIAPWRLQLDFFGVAASGLMQVSARSALGRKGGTVHRFKWMALGRCTHLPWVMCARFTV